MGRASHLDEATLDTFDERGAEFAVAAETTGREDVVLATDTAR